MMYWMPQRDEHVCSLASTDARGGLRRYIELGHYQIDVRLSRVYKYGDRFTASAN